MQDNPTLQVVQPAMFYRAWRRAFPRTGVMLYAIQAGDDGPIKIGVAAKPWERLATLQTANPVRLRGLAAWAGSQTEEAALHKMFAEDRLEGEWFKPSPALVGLVEWFGFPTCDFVKPENCFAHDLPRVGSDATCQACGMQFFAR